MNILYLCAFVPFPVTDGDHVRAEFTLRALAQRHRIFGYFLDPEGAGVPRELKRLCAGVERVPISPGRILMGALRSLIRGESIHAHAHFHSRFRGRLEAAVRRWPVQAVHVHRIRMMPYAEVLGLPYVLDATDCLGRYFKHSSRLGGMRRLYASLDGAAVARMERKWANKAVATLVTTALEKRRMHAEGAAKSRVRVVPNGMDMDHWSPGKAGTRGRELVFLGNLKYPPNEKGLAWFLREIAPKIAAARPGLRLNVIGGGAGRVLLRSAIRCRMPVRYSGFDPDPRPALRRAFAMVCPLPLASGMQNKAVQGLACGAPLVATRNVAGALNARPGRDLLADDEPEGFADCIIRLVDDPGLARRISAAGRRLAVNRFGFAAAAARLHAAWGRQAP